MKNCSISLKCMLGNNAIWLIGGVLFFSLTLKSSPVIGEWINIGPGCGGGLRVCAFSPDPLKKKLIIGGDVGGIYVSDGSGSYRQFNIQNNGLINYRIQSLIFHPADGDIVFAGTRGGVAKSIDGGLTWQMKRTGFEPFETNGASASVYPLAIDPGNPDILYAGLGAESSFGNGFTKWDVLGYVYKTEDGGDTWVGSKIDSIALDRESIMSIVADPRNSKKLYLLSQHRFFKSVDGGKKWIEQDTLPYPDATYTSFVAQRDNPDVMLLSYAKRGDVTGVLKSIDNGRTWQEKLSYATGSADKGINRIRMHPTDNETFYITFDRDSIHGLQRTTNSGESWNKINDLDIPPDSVWFPVSEKAVDIAVDPNNPDVMCYIANRVGSAYLTEDGGQNWEQICTTRTKSGAYKSSGLNILVATDAVIHRNDPQKIIFSYRDRGIFKTEDGGQTLFKGTDPVYNDPSHVLSMAADPDDPDIVYVGRNQPGSKLTGVFISRNFGESFDSIGNSDNGLTGELIDDIEIDPKSPPSKRTIYVATEDAGVFKTVDGGSTWSAINNGLPSRNLKTNDIALVDPNPDDPDAPATLYVSARVSSVSGYVARSTDGGLNWKVVLGEAKSRDGRLIKKYSDVDIRTVVADPNKPAFVYAGNRDSQGQGVNKIFWRSEDFGETWTSVTGDTFDVGKFSWDPHTYHLRSIAADRANPGRLYAGFGINGRSHGYTGGFYYSDDYGKTWAPFDDAGLQHFMVENIVIDTQNPSRLYIASGGAGFFRYDAPPVPDK